MKAVGEKPKIFGTGLVTLDLIISPNAESSLQVTGRAVPVAMF